MAYFDHERKPLIIPFADGEEDFKYQIPVVSRRVEFAERFRRQGIGIFTASFYWGKAWQPIVLKTDNASSFNRHIWFRNEEPLDMTSYANWSAPHPYWKWRIAVEPAGLPESLYDWVDPGGGGGVSIVAEDLITSAGVLTNLPNPFSASGAHFSRFGSLQFGVTTDAGTTIIWTDPPV